MRRITLKNKHGDNVRQQGFTKMGFVATPWTITKNYWQTTELSPQVKLGIN